VHSTRRVLLFALILPLTACGSVSSAQPSAVPMPTTAAPRTRLDRLGADDSAALLRLASLSGPIDATTAAEQHLTTTLVSSLPPDEQTTFDSQIAATVDAAKRFTTTDQAAAAGYVQSSTQLPGIGTHWVKWSLIDQPFDPAQPAMLLFDQSTLHPTRLAGFSYWVRNVGAPPEGFAGPNDVWHRHSGLCFENAFLAREGVASADQCSGQWLNGSDLWMLHAWVAPDAPNSAGLFAPLNTALCPPYWQALPDMLKCGGDSGGHDHGAPVVADGSAFYCHLPPT
jgi:hypothetical protein